jgi:hypothetical protein
MFKNHEDKYHRIGNVSAETYSLLVVILLCISIFSSLAAYKKNLDISGVFLAQ